MSGVFIARGMTFALTNISLAISPDGRPETPARAMVGFDACIPWLEIAANHLSLVTTFEDEDRFVWEDNDSDAKGRSLRREVQASMQIIVAAATAIDAFFSKVKSTTEIENPYNQISSQRENTSKRRSARYAIVAETLRVTFNLREEGFKQLREVLKQIYQYRNWAVHPSGELSNPVLHPKMKSGVEFRFVAFSYSNARLIFDSTFEIVRQLANKGHPENKKLQDYCRYLAAEIASIRKEEVMPPTSPTPP